MKYEIEMQVKYVPLPARRRVSYFLALREIFRKAMELAHVDRSNSGDDDDEFVFGC